jgi:hypothetical protein
MTTGPNGELVTVSERLADIEDRHGAESIVVRALRLAEAEVERAVATVERLFREQ